MVETPEWQLTGERQGRGRVYDQVESFTNGSRLRDLCADANSFARSHDPTMPCDDDALRHTHLLCLYYSNPTKFGWHRDNGSHDGQSLAPVVSASLGEPALKAPRVGFGGVCVPCRAGLSCTPTIRHC